MILKGSQEKEKEVKKGKWEVIPNESPGSTHSVGFGVVFLFCFGFLLLLLLLFGFFLGGWGFFGVFLFLFFALLMEA